jgi:homoaconitase/3-isopropylmalate dehydratase large subunit
MGYTIAEKILAAHSGGAPVRAGEVVVADVDFAMMHDARAGNAMKMAAVLFQAVVLNGRVNLDEPDVLESKKN